jgi:hypothetical protein
MYTDKLLKIWRYKVVFSLWLRQTIYISVTHWRRVIISQQIYHICIYNNSNRLFSLQLLRRYIYYWHDWTLSEFDACLIKMKTAPLLVNLVLIQLIDYTLSARQLIFKLPCSVVRTHSSKFGKCVLTWNLILLQTYLCFGNTNMSALFQSFPFLVEPPDQLRY